MLNHIDVGDDNFVVRLEFFKLFWIVSPSRSVAHYHCVPPLAVDKIKHIGAHAFDLQPVDFKNLIGKIVQRWIREFQYELLSLFLVLDSGHAHDSMIVQ